jgi:hypothetical protein
LCAMRRRHAAPTRETATCVVMTLFASFAPSTLPQSGIFLSCAPWTWRMPRRSMPVAPVPTALAALRTMRHRRRLASAAAGGQQRVRQRQQQQRRRQNLARPLPASASGDECRGGVGASASWWGAASLNRGRLLPAAIQRTTWPVVPQPG